VSRKKGKQFCIIEADELEAMAVNGVKFRVALGRLHEMVQHDICMGNHCSIIVAIRDRLVASANLPFTTSAKRTERKHIHANVVLIDDVIHTTIVE